MCSGCCRYIPDEYTKKIPFVGEWLVERYNAETGGWFFEIMKFFCRKQIEQCHKDWKEMLENEK